MTARTDLKKNRASRMYRSSVTDRFVTLQLRQVSGSPFIEEPTIGPLGSDGLTATERTKLAEEARAHFNLMSAEEFRKSVAAIDAFVGL